MLVNGAKKTQEVKILDWIFCIYYLVQFQKDKKVMRVLINSSNKISIMTLPYAKQLSLWIRKTDIKVYKIDKSSLKTFRMVIAGFQVIDKLAWV